MAIQNWLNQGAGLMADKWLKGDIVTLNVLNVDNGRVLVEVQGVVSLPPEVKEEPESITKPKAKKKAGK